MEHETVIVEIKCRWCGKVHYVKVRKSDFESFCNGDMRASGFYYLSPAEHELFISQTCDDCWNKMFPEDEEDSFEDYEY